jgi:hypothetical protein
VGADGLGCGIIRRTKTRLGWKCRPERAAFFLRVAKDEMQWQRYEAAPTLFLYSRIAARFLAVARACHVNSVAILSRDLRTSSRTRRSAPCCGQLGLHRRDFVPWRFSAAGHHSTSLDHRSPAAESPRRPRVRAQAPAHTHAPKHLHISGQTRAPLITMGFTPPVAFTVSLVSIQQRCRSRCCLDSKGPLQRLPEPRTMGSS